MLQLQKLKGGRVNSIIWRGGTSIFFDALPKDLQTNSLVANRTEAASRNASNPSAGMEPSVLDPSGVMV